MNLSETISERAVRWVRAVALEVRCNEGEDIRYGIEYNLAHRGMAVHTFSRASITSSIGRLHPIEAF
jgi:hypothetical protein